MCLLWLYFLFDWRPKHVTLDLYEVVHTTRQELVTKIIDHLDISGLRNRIIVYVKYKGSNLNTLTSAQKSIVNCEA